MGKKEGVPIRRYTEEFKTEAVRLALSAGGNATAVPHHAPLPARLHLARSRCAPVARASDALHVQATRSSAFLLVRPFAPCRQLLWPLLTPRPSSSPSPFRA